MLLSVYHTGADTLAFSFFGIRNHADLRLKEKAALDSLSHTETGHIARTKQLEEGYRKSPPCCSMLAGCTPAKLPACFIDCRTAAWPPLSNFLCRLQMIAVQHCGQLVL